MKLTPKTLAAEARRISGDIDARRWQLAKLAAQAKAEGVEGWAEIIGIECRRMPRTIRAWAATWEWCSDNRIGGYVDTQKLPYSFFECASQKAEAIDLDTLIELMQTYERDPGATYESFRAELSALVENDPTADFRHWAEKERTRIFSWIDRAPSRRAGDCLRLAADALMDSLEAVDD